MKRRDLERHLIEHGCQLDREGGQHSWWVGPSGRASIPRHREIKPNLVRAICRQLDVPAPGNVN